MGYKTKIDWCDSTWSPVTGCQHDCDYCYARGLARRFGGHNCDANGRFVRFDMAMGPQRLAEPKFILRDGKIQKAAYPWFFLPTLHEYRLGIPLKWSEPRTIFVCSMADLFGEWVPDEWIQEVFAACEAAPQHRYLFLTKNPMRYQMLYEDKALPYRNNYWFGTTVTTPDDHFTWFDGTPYHGFLSIEPILAPFGNLESIRKPEWVIIGAETGNRKEKNTPERWWIENLAYECAMQNIPVFMKESLRELMGEDFRQELPWRVAGTGQ